MMCGVTSLTRYTLGATAMHDPDPVNVLTTLNTVLHERYSNGAPATAPPSSGPCTPQVTAARFVWPPADTPPR